MSANTKSKRKKNKGKTKRDHLRKSGNKKIVGSNGQLVVRCLDMHDPGDKIQWAEWQEYLAHRKCPILLGRLNTPGGQSALLWSVPRQVENSQLMTWIQRCGEVLGAKKTADVLCLSGILDIVIELSEKQEGCDLESGDGLAADEALLTVATALILPRLASNVCADQWYRALNCLVSFADRPIDCQRCDPWTLHLLRVELPLSLACVLPESAEIQKQGRVAAKEMISQLERCLDSDGWLEAHHLNLWRPLLATWTRSWYLIDALDLQPFDRDSILQWEWFLRQSMRLMRRDGSQMLTESDEGTWCGPLFESAINTSSDGSERKIAKRVFPNRQLNAKPHSLLLDENEFSEWAGLGVLDSGWLPDGPKIAVAIQEQNLRFEICRAISLIEGRRLPEISCNGRLLAPSGKWEVTCNHSDEDVEFLELELGLENNFRIQRQFLLARADEFALVSDVVISPSRERIDYRLELGIAADVSFVHETETNELYLTDRRILSLVLPITIPEWKTAGTDDGLHAESDCLVLSQSAIGTSLYAGLFFDLNSSRSKKPRTWRRLTVADELEIVSTDLAVAFRVQIGREQWVIYRSIESVGNRSFLGENKCCEFFVGRFHTDGFTDELLTIEYSRNHQ